MPASAQAPEEVGQWSPVMSWPISATHAHLLPTGKVMFFGEFEEGLLPPRLWDPQTNGLTSLPTPHYNIFCAGHSYLADGRLLLTGGHVESHEGEPHAVIFNPFTSSWEHAPDMNDKRWYPTNVTLSNGDIVVLSGETIGSGTSNELPQRWVASSGTWKDLSTAMKDLPYYPRTFLAPDGKLFCAGPRRSSYYLDPEGTGSWFEAARSLFGGRTYGGAVMFDGKVLIVGGGDPPTNTTELIDLTAPTPTWVYRAPMSVARRQHNTTLLPDGTVLVLGGSRAAGFDEESGAVFHGEVWNPATNTWKSLASASVYHGYHSTAVLLPDGRVLLAGGRLERRAAVFSPPYLFKGARPGVTSAPDVLQPGTSFFVETPDAAQVTQVTLLALTSTTHAFDQNQRLLTLSFAPASGGLTVTAPASNTLAPPGPYLLFLVNAQGVPSVGKIVRVEKVQPRGRKVIHFSDVWKYDDSNVDRGTAWLAADYDDSGWQSGPGQLGYGDGDEGKVLTRTTPSQPSVYFRKKITLDSPVTAARLELLHDDGVQVWVNGVPVFSRYMGEGLGFASYASGSGENEYSRATIPLTPNPFVVGENIVTAMVKQVSGASEDLTFALGLEVELWEGPVPDTLALAAPNGGEVLRPGHAIPIRWSTTGTVGTVALEYSLDDGATWTLIASGVAASAGSYAWTVPDVTTSRGRVRVSQVGGGLADTSDASFIISHEVMMQPIVFGDVWRYQDSGLDPGAGWSTLGFDDAAWGSGAGQLGYGDGDETTVLSQTTPSQPSVYFRKKITLSGPVTSATLRVLFDDGVVVYVNGIQVFSRNVTFTDHGRYASAGAENELQTAALSLSPNPFVMGENVIAVMVKQNGRTSPDLTFDLALEVGVTGGGH
jgi:galactose oxidase